MSNNAVMRGAVGLAVLALCVAGCEKREIRNSHTAKTTIVCVGDSLTFGYGAERSEAYPCILGKLTGRQVVNAGIDGQTSAAALSRLDKDVLTHDPGVVIIELGGNDFLTKVPFDDTARTVKEMVERIQETGAMVALVDISSGMLLQQYAPLYHKLADETGSIYIQGVMTGIVTNPSMKSDFLHPNAQGYRLMAGRIYDALQPYLEPQHR